MKSLCLPFLAGIMLSGCGVLPMHLGGPQTVGKGPVKSEKRTVPMFCRVDASGGYQIEFTRDGSKDYMTIEAQSDILPKLKSKIEGDTLKLWTEGNFSTTEPIRVKISSLNLDQVNLNGACRLTANKIESGEFRAKLSGASHLEAKSFKARSIDAKLEGASHLQLNGSADKATLSANGASKIPSGLSIGQGTVEANGASEISVRAATSVKADANGASQVRITGPAKVTKKVSGAASVN